MLRRLTRLREIKPAEFRRMELEAATVTSAFRDEFRANFKGVLTAMDGLMALPDYANAVWRRQLYGQSHGLKGLGGTFNYDLITTIGDSLCSLIKSGNLPDDRFLQRRVAAHVAALNAIFQFDLRGDGGDEGANLLATLSMRPLCRRPVRP